nr:protein S100-A6-like [Pelodiscus sinensis]|eukprot:XP_006127212.1 protein S100-A6-like [Pelodiscus sinensis]
MALTPLDQALWCMVLTYHKYAKKDKKTLSKGELKELIQKELSLGAKLPEEKITELTEDLDKNKDEIISFPEFSSLLGALCMAYNEALQGAAPPCGTPDEDGGGPAGPGH